MKRPLFSTLIALACLLPASLALAEALPTTAQYGAVGMGSADLAVHETIVADASGLALENEQILVAGSTAIEAPEGTSFTARNALVLEQEGGATTPAEPAIVVAPGASAALLGTTVMVDDMVALSLPSATAPAAGLGSAALAGVDGAAVIGSGLASTASDGIDVGEGRTLRLYGTYVVGSYSGINMGASSDAVIGTIAAGYDDEALAGFVTDEDRSRWGTGEAGCVIDGANALVVSGTPEGQAALPSGAALTGAGSTASAQTAVAQSPVGGIAGSLISSIISSSRGAVESTGVAATEPATAAVALEPIATKVRAANSELVTDVSLANVTGLTSAEKGLFSHTAGSAIVAKSAFGEIELDACTIDLDKNGTGCLVQTIPTAPPAEADAPRTVEVTFSHMDVAGNVAHEDFGGSLGLNLSATDFRGTTALYDAKHWADAAKAEGFDGSTASNVPASQQDQQGLAIRLRDGSNWTVTATSHATSLSVSGDSKILGTVYVNGSKTEPLAGTTYKGDIVIEPLTGTDAASLADAQQDGKTGSDKDHTHNWVRSGSTAADCTHDGTVTYTCSVCNEKRTEATPALGHDWTFYSGVAASCETGGQELYVCSRCGETAYFDTPALGHDWVRNGGSPGSCTTDGNKAWVCTRCGQEYLEIIPATGHSYVQKDFKAATCEADGYETFACEYCGDTYTDVYPATGHHWVSTAYQGPSCSSDGYETFTCDTCGASYNQAIPATPHNYVWVYRLDPTCTDEGYDEYECSVCGTTYKDPIPANGHIYSEVYSNPVSCTSDGYNTYQCTVCGDVYTETYAYAYGHSYFAYITPDNPTMTHTYECANCGDTYTELHTGGDPCAVCGYSGPVG